jgi:hypothetical protein
LEQARARSLEFETTLTQTLEQTHKDIAQVDWKEEVPTLLRKALIYVGTRLAWEHNMLNGLNDPSLRYETREEEFRHTQMLKEMFVENFSVHTRLHGLLLGARNVFFKEQERQAFKPRG